MVLQKGFILTPYKLTGCMTAHLATGGVPLWDSLKRSLVTLPLHLEEGETIVVTCPGFQTVMTYDVFQKHFVRLSGKRFAEQFTSTEWKYDCLRVKPVSFPQKVQAAVSHNSKDGSPQYVYANHTHHGKLQPTMVLDLHVFSALYTKEAE